ncbi:helix-turn-helix transcriptional regulator [Phenylobacterium sp.]|uniref:helix-turn-helix transcriptional regulator n=1 Tax=Phenylobacterium sp. TaxID=1871053 RepID=UPI00286DF55B|nr:helix-turn-helix transcriptional regulator [Phenylobacterium sp.]
MKFINTLTDEAAQAELGARAARARLERGWTQAQLAKAAGVSKATVERLESGASTQLHNLLRCLRALDKLENLESLLPESTPGPIDLLSRRGKVRQRARSRKTPTPPPAPWSWGETP